MGEVREWSAGVWEFWATEAHWRLRPQANIVIEHGTSGEEGRERRERGAGGRAVIYGGLATRAEELLLLRAFTIVL